MHIRNDNAKLAVAALNSSRSTTTTACNNTAATAATTTPAEDHSMALYSGVLLSWLEKYDAQYFYSQPAEEVRRLVKDTLDLLVGVLNYFSCPTNMLTVVIKYANTFVVRNGIRQVVLLHLLFISTITTIKMWCTENMSVNSIIADLFHLSLVDLNNMEREFLKSLDYELYLTDADVSGYLADITTAHVASVLRHRIRVAAKKAAASSSPSSSTSAYTPTPAHTTTARTVPTTTTTTTTTDNNHNNKRKASVMYNYDATTPTTTATTSTTTTTTARRYKQPRIILKAAIAV